MTPYQPDYLIVKLAAAGDVLLTTALLHAVRRARPDAHLAWLVSSYAAPLLAANPDLNQMLIWPAPDQPHRVAATLQAWAGVRHWARQHPAATVLLAHRSQRLRAMLRAAGLRRIVAWGRDTVFDPALHRLQLQAGLLATAGLADAYPLIDWRGTPLGCAGRPAYARPAAGPRAPQPVERAAMAGCGTSGLAPQLHLLPRERAAGERGWGAAPRPRWVIAPGGGNNPWAAMPNRRWPLERFRALGDMARAAGISILWLGGAADESLLAKLPPRAPDRVCTGLPVRHAGALIAAADLTIGNDSLPLVLAQALGRLALGLYGPTAGATIHDPRAPFLQGQAGCGPCYDPRRGRGGEAYRCPRARCMETISARAVWEAAAALGASTLDSSPEGVHACA